MKTSFNVVHLTDIHLGQPESPIHVTEQVDKFNIMLERIAHFHSKEGQPIDFVLITGDIIEEEKPADYNMHYIKIFFNKINKILLKRTKLDPERILFVPGNHDQDLLSNILNECKEYGFTAGNIGQEGKYMPIFKSFWPDYNIAFTLFNSGLSKLNNKSAPDNDFKPIIERYQLDAVSELIRNNAKEIIPLIALFHHHLLPISFGADAGEPQDSSDILANSSQLLAWLRDNNHFAVFHGHKHRSSFAKHTSYCFKNEFDEPNFDKILYIISGDSLLSNHTIADVDCSYKYIEVHTVHDLYNPRIVVHKKRFHDDNFIPAGTATSHSDRKLFQEQVYEEENFLSCKIPNSPSQEKWFWEQYNEFIFNGGGYTNRFFNRIIDENGRKYIVLKDFEDRKKDLEELIKRIHKYNRKNSLVFSMTPYQLKCLYCVGSLFFTYDEASFAAEEEFGNQTRPFSDFIDAIKRQGIRVQLRSHLDWANAIIAKETLNSFKNTNDLNILECGFGGLCTLYKIAETFELGETGVNIQYTGIDISGKIQEKANEIYLRTKNENILESLKIITPYPGLELFYTGDFATQISPRGIFEMTGKWPKKPHDIYDICVASYSFHHISSPNRIIESIIDGSILNYFTVTSDPIPLTNSILDNKIFEDKVINTEKLQLKVRSILKKDVISQDSRSIRSDLNKLFKNNQIECIKNVHRLLKPDGLFIIADPNGFSSSFNRKLIFEDALLPLSFFNEFAEIAIYLERNFFEIKKIYRQVRLRNGHVSNIEIDLELIKNATDEQFIKIVKDLHLHDTHAKKFNKSAEYRSGSRSAQEDPMRLDYDDLHLGYIVIAKKPKTGSIFKTYFEDKAHLFFL